MKKLILITILSLHIFQLSAQVDWFEEGAKWDYIYGGFVFYGTTSLEYQGDTIANNLTLNKVSMQNIHINDQYVADTTNSQLFFYQDSNVLYQYVEDTLKKLYDFNLSVGDTLDYVIDNNFTYSILDSISEVQVDNHNLTIQHIELTYEFEYADSIMSYTYPPVRVAERIGHLNTFFLPEFGFFIASDDIEYFLQCYTDDSGISTRFDGNFVPQECNPETTSINHASLDKLQISPNPTTDIIRVELSISNITELKLFSITGQLLLTQNTDNKLVENINLSSLNNGFYYLIGYDDNGNMMSTNKVIKN